MAAFSQWCVSKAGRGLEQTACGRMLRVAWAAFPRPLKGPCLQAGSNFFPDGSIEAKTFYSAVYNEKRRKCSMPFKVIPVWEGLTNSPCTESRGPPKRGKQILKAMSRNVPTFNSHLAYAVSIFRWEFIAGPLSPWSGPSIISLLSPSIKGN